jgi:AcrR family transcriptional regulator
MERSQNREVDRPARKRRSDGERSHNAILREAARLATVEGIEGLSIGRLADAVGMSKSGLFAHFGSKEELQLATIEAAGAEFAEQVTGPALAEDTGLGRLRGLGENFLRYVEGVYPGGCFFASVSAEMDTRPGPVRDRAMQLQVDWLELMEAAIGDAQSEGSLDSTEDPKELAFELTAYLYLANAQFVASREQAPIERARRAIERRLASAGAAT